MAFSLLSRHEADAKHRDEPKAACRPFTGRSIDGRAEAATLEKLIVPGSTARVERGMLINVEGFDWNCPQHITPRFTAEEVAGVVLPLKRRIAELEAELASL